MKRSVAAGLLALLAITAAGCGPDVPDYVEVWTTTTTPPTTTTAPGPVPLHQYLESVGVIGTPVAPNRLPDLTVTMPTPPGWKPYTNPAYAPGTRVIAKGDTYPIAMLMVFELEGDFDVAEALSHGYVDAEMSANFKRLNASTEDWRGLPSAMIEGSYDLNGRRMQTYNRIVFATGTPPKPAPGRPPPPGQRYLVQLTITSFAEDAAEYGPDIATILKGFNVAPK